MGAKTFYSLFTGFAQSNRNELGSVHLDPRAPSPVPHSSSRPHTHFIGQGALEQGRMGTTMMRATTHNTSTLVGWKHTASCLADRGWSAGLRLYRSIPLFFYLSIYCPHSLLFLSFLSLPSFPKRHAAEINRTDSITASELPPPMGQVIHLANSAGSSSTCVYNYPTTTFGSQLKFFSPPPNPTRSYEQ